MYKVVTVRLGSNLAGLGPNSKVAGNLLPTMKMDVGIGSLP